MIKSINQPESAIRKNRNNWLSAHLKDFEGDFEGIEEAIISEISETRK